MSLPISTTGLRHSRSPLLRGATVNVAVGVAQTQGRNQRKSRLHDAPADTVGAEVLAAHERIGGWGSGMGKRSMPGRGIPALQIPNPDPVGFHPAASASSQQRRAQIGASAAPAAAQDRSRSSRQSTIWSTVPWSSRTRVWKPSGGVSHGPARSRAGGKPISASGSAMLTSPSIASRADTPPVVGLVIADEQMRPRAPSGDRAPPRSWPSASARTGFPCMRAPPDAEKHTRQRVRFRTLDGRWQKRSPTTSPSTRPHDASQRRGRRPAAAAPRRCLPSRSSASRSPLDFFAARSVGVLLWSLNLDVGRAERSADSTPWNRVEHRQQPARRADRHVVPALRRPRRFSPSSGRYRTAPHLSQLCPTALGHAALCVGVRAGIGAMRISLLDGAVGFSRFGLSAAGTALTAT